MQLVPSGTQCSKLLFLLLSTLHWEASSNQELYTYFTAEFSQQHCEIDTIFLISQTEIETERGSMTCTVPSLQIRFSSETIWLLLPTRDSIHHSLPFSFFLSPFLSSYTCCVNLIKDQVMVPMV